MKKFIAILLILILCCNTVFASDKVKFYAGIQNDFSPSSEIPETVEFITSETVKINDEIEIPSGSIVKARTCQYQTERRWHKSGFFICNLLSYLTVEDELVELSDKEIYFIVRKYVAMSKKDASILGAEIVLTQAASIVASCFIVFAPVDIAYFFTKGAIVRKKNPNWFKSGVMEAYDNSIFWFQLKGKPIELAEGDDVKIQSLTPKRAEKLNSKIEKRNIKKAAKQQKREDKKVRKQQRKDDKLARKEQKRQEKETKKHNNESEL